MHKYINVDIYVYRALYTCVSVCVHIVFMYIHMVYTHVHIHGV